MKTRYKVVRDKAKYGTAVAIADTFNPDYSEEKRLDTFRSFYVYSISLDEVKDEKKALADIHELCERYNANNKTTRADIEKAYRAMVNARNSFEDLLYNQIEP